MKLASIVLAAATALVAVSAQETAAPTTAPVGAGTVSAAAGAEVTTPAATPAAASGSAASAAAPAAGAASGDLLATFKATPTTDEYHMEPVRVVHARVQSDSPILVEGQLVSSFGKGKLDAGYLSSLDSVNTASVEGALMYVQAEAINVKKRDDRCVRKTKVQNVVFYEILISQTNETIAQFSDGWSTPEYGPMIAMDSGRCTPTEGEDKLPVECYQFNGENGQPNVGPFVGGTNKEDSDRAPYPGNYWFSFPGSCADQLRAGKTDDCRAKHAGGLCPMGTAPDGDKCSFAYKILGYLNIDDLVGITSLKNKAGVTYANYTEFCEDGGVEFDATNTGSGFTVKDSLKFWENPGDEKANSQRAEDMVEMYNKLAPNAKVGTMTALPTISDLAKANPKCYENSEKCATAKNGCRRTLYAQVCEVCSAAGDGCEVAPSDFKYPTLIKPTQAPTPAPASGDSSVSGDSDNIKVDDLKSSAAKHASTVASAALAIGAVALALF